MNNKRKKKLSIETQRINIIEAAKFCILKKGANGCSMKDIQGMSGLSPGQVYRCFKNKTQIVSKVIESNFYEQSCILPVIYRQKDIIRFAISGALIVENSRAPGIMQLRNILRIEVSTHPTLAATYNLCHSRLNHEHMELVSTYWPEIKRDKIETMIYIIDLLLSATIYENPGRRSCSNSDFIEVINILLNK